MAPSCRVSLKLRCRRLRCFGAPWGSPTASRNNKPSSEDFSLLVAFLLVTFSWFFRGFFVALFCLEKQCSGLFRYFFVAFSWLFRGFFVAPVLGKFYAYSPWNSLLTSGMFRRSASLAIPHRKSFAAIPSVSLPVLPFLFFLGGGDFLVFPCEDSPCFLCVFPFFSKVFGGSVGIHIRRGKVP